MSNRLNGRWRHFKGAVYVVTSVARHTESNAEMVVYHSEAKPEEVWVRPLWLWLSPVPGGGARFVRLGPAGGDGGGRAE